MTDSPAAKRLLLLQRGQVFLAEPTARGASSPALVQAVALELAELGYALSDRLFARLIQLPEAALVSEQAALRLTLEEQLGADAKHTPLFRRFPHDVPEDTRALWWQKVLVHYMQAPDQACLFCQRRGTTHVLSPCRHVVCGQCFDGSNYSACPSTTSIGRRPSSSPRTAPKTPGRTNM